MVLLDTLLKVKEHAILKGLDLHQLLAFLRLAALLKNDITLAQPVSVSTSSAPEFLPPSISDFLSESVGIPQECMSDCWDILKDDVWSFPSSAEMTAQDEGAFRSNGWKRGITSLTLYPPLQHCTNTSCTRSKPLKRDEHRQVVVYTLSSGVRPAWSVHLTCPDCHTNYHHNFAVQNGVRTYYGGLPDYVQVGEHQFVEPKVISMWTSMMLVGWFSATNCARAYDMSLSQRQTDDMVQGGWQFGAVLATEHVWDAFVIWTLLKDHTKRNLCLQVPHTGLQKDRFTAQMQARNEYVILHGQDEVPHVCNKCMWVFTQDDGTYRKCQVIVCDGNAMGFPCCGVFRCTNPLCNNRHRFCGPHFPLHNICAITGCDRPVVPGTKACDNAEHRKMERLHFEKGKAAFTLKERLQKHRVMHPNNALAHETPFSADHDADDLEENIEWFEVDDGDVRVHGAKNPGSIGVVDHEDDNDSDLPCEATKSDTGNRKFKAQFGRRRTHNEQILVRPCGVIFARATFYGAEAVSNVLLFVKNAFSVPGAHKPKHLAYDTNCDAKQQVLASGDPYFADMGMCVDVWHFLNKHKVTHKFCQEHCNPADYPELMGPDGNWFFNTSVAEQTNAWLGGYHAICREMLPVKYNFFLDEMIRLRNKITVMRLEAAGHNPRHAPHPT